MTERECYPFSDLLRGFRKREGMSQQTLADCLGKHRNTIRNWERGDCLPKYADVTEIVRALMLSQQDQESLLYACGSGAAGRALSALPNSEPMWKVPPSLTPLLGREQDLNAACMRLTCPEVRLLTLVGTGGVGKTRLALQLATVLRDSFVDGVCFVELAAISDPSLVMQTIAHELEIRENGMRSLMEHVKAKLRTKNLLLLLDNFEQVSTAGPLIEELVAACPSLKVVVTSRIALRLQVEHLFHVFPLKFPDLTQQSETAFAESAAVSLFLQRAQAVLPTFRLTPTNARTVAEICVRLDGLPLAIELASAHIRLLSPQALLTRLSQQLDMPTRRAPTLPIRQQTLRNTFVWSYNLLDVQEQRLLRRLAIFMGGCTLQAAEKLCESIVSGSVLESIASLLDKSLLQRVDHDGEDEPHFIMFETIREYGLELLHKHGEYKMARLAHTQYVLDLAQEAEPHLRRGTQQILWRKRLEREQENLRAALQWLIEQKDVEHALQLSRITAYFWLTQGYLGEARRWLAATLQLPWEQEHGAARARVLSTGGDIAWRQGDFVCAQTMLEESVTLSRSLREISILAFSLGQLGRLLCDQGNAATGEARLEESIELSRRTGDQWLLATMFGMYGRVKRKRGDFKAACTLLEQSLSIFHEIADTTHLMITYTLLGETLLTMGKWKQAQEYFQKSLTLIQRGASPLFHCDILLGLGHVAMAQGGWTRAESLYMRNLSLAQQIDHPPRLAHALIALAHLKRCQGNLAQASLLAEKSRMLIEGQGDTELVSLQFLVLGEIARDMGDLIQATSLFEQGLAFVRSRGDQPIMGWFLIGLATVAKAEGKFMQASHLLELVNALREKTAAMDRKRRKEYEDTIKSVQEHLGEVTS